MHGLSWSVLQFDSDGSGEIDENELKGVAAKLGVPMTEADLRVAMKEMDADGSGVPIDTWHVC